MRGKWFSVLGFMVMIMVFALAAVPAFAASPAQQGTPGMNNWYSIAAGQSQEWIFHYTGNDDRAVIELASDPANAVGFNVYTDQQWTSLSSDSTLVPTGRGTQTTHTDSNGDKTVLNNGDLFWETGASSGNTYHIQVINASSQTVRYWINASGPGDGGLAPFSMPNQVQMAQTQTNRGTTTSPSVSASAMAQARTSTTGNLQGPRTLPVTGGASDLVIWLFGIGLVLISAGWMARRRAM